MDYSSDRRSRPPRHVDELNTTQLLAHARKQAHKRNYDDMMIVDAMPTITKTRTSTNSCPFMENDVLRQLTMSGRPRRPAPASCRPVGYQDMGGRVTRYPLRSTEKTEPGQLRDVQLGHRWMDAMGVDYSCLFPTGML